LIVGEIYPLGIGFTSNPAADVKGLVAQQGESKPATSSRNEPIDKLITKSKKNFPFLSGKCTKQRNQ